MTSSGSRFRHFLYVAIATLAFMSGGISALPIPDDAKIWAGYTIGTIAAGLVASRAYIDQSESDVDPAPEPSEPEKKPYQ